MKQKSPGVVATAVVTLGSGIVNLWSVMGRRLPHAAWVRSVFPLEFVHLSRFLTLVVGFALVISSINIYVRKRRAYYVVVALALFSIVFHLVKGIDYTEAMCALVLLSLLFASRGEFTVRSGPPDWRSAATRLALATLIAVAYGVAGFWLLERREFGIDFTLRDALVRTSQVLTLRDPGLIPRTRHARWFLDSLQIMTATALLYSVYSLFRPVLYRLHTQPQERARASAILELYGRSSLDWFKLWPDKSLFFNEAGRAFLAYRVAGGFAVVLGDPVGPDDDVVATVREFTTFCEENGWRLALYQTTPHFLAAYRRLGLKSFKIGDDTIVDLRRFSLDGRARRALRSAVRKLESAGVVAVWLDPPLSDTVLRELREISDEWLRFPGRRERQFTLGRFLPEYLKSTPVMAALDSSGRILAFANVVPSYVRGEATIDLMRRRTDAPNGITEFLLIKLFDRDRRAGYERFSLGLAPMDGFTEREQATPEERAVHAFVRQLGFIFRYKGLKAFKAKFASFWEPRYVVYRHVLDLARLALALARVSEIRG
jgi:phosphatidylglycerol lysyltransferase